MAQLAIQKLPELRFHKKYKISYWKKARVINNWVAIQTCRQTDVCLCTLAFTFQDLSETNHTNVYIFNTTWHLIFSHSDLKLQTKIFLLYNAIVPLLQTRKMSRLNKQQGAGVVALQ